MAAIPIFQATLRDVLPISSAAAAAAASSIVVLDKGALLPIENCAAVTLGLGWDPVPSSSRGSSRGRPKNVDLDAGVALLNKDNIYEDFVYFHNQSSPGIHHSGDNRTGEGDGDDEQIKIVFNELSPAVERLVLAISAHEGTFMAVENAYVRLLDTESGKELVKFTLSGRFKETSILCCKLFRDKGSWRLLVLGEPLGGKSIVDFFWTDPYGEPARLRSRFKELSGCYFDDAKFFRAVDERLAAGHEQLRTDKPDV